MRSYITHTAEALHDRFRVVAKAGALPLNLQEAFELGMLLVMVERGVLSTQEEAIALGATTKTAVAFGRILRGEVW